MNARSRTIRGVVPALVVLLLAAACGSEGLGSVGRSELSRDVPEVPGPALDRAVPRPVDLGPGWTLPAGQIGDEDYFLEHARTQLVATCGGSYPAEALQLGGSAHARSATLLSADPPVWVGVHLAVDSPGGSADRLAWIRAAYHDCGPLELDTPGGRVRESYTFVDPPPDVRADEAFVVRIVREPVGDGAQEDRRVNLRAYVRSGGLVVAMDTNEKPDVLPALQRIVARAREALNL